jgi:hypothetical protein
VDALKGVMIYAERTGQKTVALKGRKGDAPALQSTLQ